MGAEHSCIVANSPLSWRTLHYGIHYAATDVAVWPHLSPLAQWFTAHDALALKSKLNQRTSTNLLSFDEFVAWLQNGKAPQVLHKAAMPERHDIMTPPNLVGTGSSLPPPIASKLRGDEDKDPMATRMLELYLEHVFYSFKGNNSSKLYAMEFLAAFVLVSRAIWSLEEKVRVLMKLFHDPALSARHAASSSAATSFGSKHQTSGSYEKCFRETDLAQLLLCVMRGVAKVTVGVGHVWDHHGLSIATLARQFAATSMNDALEARKLHAQQVTYAVPVSPSKLSKATTSPKRSGGGSNPRFVPGGISEREFLKFVVAKPVIQRFLALFVGEELRNPFTFSPLSSLCIGVAFPESYRFVIDQQTKVYHSLLKNYVTFEGRDAKRVLSAVILIQSTWRRRCSRTLLEQHKEERIRQRHASAATLQSYLRQFQFAKVLEQHADAEREALNGGLFVAGSGACIPSPKVQVPSSTSNNKLSATREHPGLTVLTTPLKLIETFKFLNVRICSVTASQTCALALADDRKTLFAWGRCLPCIYQSSSGAWSSDQDDADEDSNTVRLFQTTPTRLAHRFFDDEQVVQLACGLRHALVLTDGGMVYSWGFNDHGQLGHGSADTLEARTGGRVSYGTYFDERDGREYEFLGSPTRLLYFQGSAAQHAEPIPIQQICCGDYYSMALSRDGDAFTWGEASEGQLGHGDAHEAFQVAFVDLHMLNSAYTFLSQPEPVLVLSDIEIVQIGCRKNHSVALTSDGRVFEWGNWGKRCGHDMEHAFVPIEKEHVSDLRLRQLSVGDHHIVAEGSSVWMNLVASVASGVSASACQPETEDSGGDANLQQQQRPEDGFGVTKGGFYLTCAAYSCSFEAIETYFAGKDRPWTCTIVEFDVDDLEDEAEVAVVEADCPGNVNQQETLSTSQGQQQSDLVGVHSVWAKRVQQYALSVEQVGRFDTRTQQLRSFSYRQNVGYSYEKLLNMWLFGHVEDRFVVFPRGKPAGFYVQFLLPLESISRSETEQRVEAEQAEGYVAPAVVEFRVCGSNTAARAINKRGFAVHAFHPGMEDAKLTKIQRMKKKKASVVTDENSLFLLEFDESCLPSTASLESGHSNVDIEEDDTQMDLSALIVGEMQERVLAAQESGVLAVLIVLDLFDVEPFELHFDDDSGVYIPVLMINKYALAVQDAWALDSSSSPPSRKRLAFHELVDLMIAPLEDADPHSIHRSTMIPSSRFVSRPMWTTRCFCRVDTLSARVQCALNNGAAGVVLVQNSESLEMDGETRGAPIFHHSLSTGPADEKRLADKLVAMISHEEGARLRASSHMSMCQKYMPLLSKEGSNYELLVHVSFEIRAGGTTYAWGNGQNGRLGVGPSASDAFKDGYEALTDTAYRFVDQPTPIAVLAGTEMKQLACGTAHSLAVSRQGKVFTWGRGSRGALAQVSSSNNSSDSQKKKKKHDQSTKDVWVPRQVHSLRFENIVQVAANDVCSLFLTEIVLPELYRERRREIAQLKAVARKSLL